MRSSKPQQPLPRRKLERPLVPESEDAREKGTSPGDDRPKDADYVAQSRWRNQPTRMSKPENLTSGDSKFGLSAIEGRAGINTDPRIGLAPIVRENSTSIDEKFGCTYKGCKCRMPRERRRCAPYQRWIKSCSLEGARPGHSGPWSQ
jgi:hypothetical protein